MRIIGGPGERHLARVRRFPIDGLPGGGTHNFAFNTFVGNTLRDLRNSRSVQQRPGGKGLLTRRSYYGEVQGSIDAWHTARVVLSAPAGVTFAAALGPRLHKRRRPAG